MWIPVTADHLAAVQAGEIHAASTLHAMRALEAKRRTVDVVCGLSRAKPYAARAVDPDGGDQGLMVLAWPPPKVYEEMGRCRLCWEETGRPRPNPQFRQLKETTDG